MKHLKQLKAVLLLTFFFIFSAKAEKDVFLSFQFGMYDFAVDTGTSSAAVNGIGAYSVGVAYAFADQWLISGSLEFLRASTLTGDAATGVDVSTRWYPFTFSGYKYYSDNQIDYSLTQLWRPYVGFGIRQRQFILAITTTYLGAGFFTGVDYQLTEKIHLNGEIRYDQYQGSDEETTATMMNILFGLGYHF